LINPLPGNRSVNAVQHATIDGAVFSMFSASLPVLVTDLLTRSLTREYVFSVLFAQCNNKGTVFSLRGPYREDKREYGNGNFLDLSSEVPREQQVDQKKNQKT
jgi:hypothetical protein